MSVGDWYTDERTGRGWWEPERHACKLAQHRCLLYVGYCRQHRRVFGDLVPIEQYRNGGDGRHHRSGNPFGSEVSVDRLRRRAAYEATTTSEMEQ